MKNEFLVMLNKVFGVMTLQVFLAFSRLLDLIKQSEDYLMYARLLAFLASKGSRVYTTEDIFQEIATMKDNKGDNFPSRPYIGGLLLWLKQAGLINYPLRPTGNAPFDVDIGPLHYKHGFTFDEARGNIFLCRLHEAFCVMTFKDLRALNRVDESIKQHRDHLLLLRTLVYIATRGNGDYTRQELLSGVSTMLDAHRERFPSLFSIETLLTTLKSKKFIDFPVRQTSDEPYAINVDTLFQTWGFPDNSKEGEVSNG